MKVIYACPRGLDVKLDMHAVLVQQLQLEAGSMLALLRAVASLATTASALLSELDEQHSEELAAMLGLQRVLEAASCVLGDA